MAKHVIFKEGKLPLLKEGLSNKVYHFTSVENAYDILTSNTLYLSSSVAKDAEEAVGGRMYYLSMTRVRDSRFGYSKKFSEFGARIELDGEKLMERYKGQALNYWNGLGDKFQYFRQMDQARGNGQDVSPWALSRWMREHPNATDEDEREFVKRNFNQDFQTQTSTESEDRLYSKEPYIRNVGKYIISVDVVINGLFSDEKLVKEAYAIMIRSNKARIFSNTEDFNNPNGKDVNEEVKDYMRDNNLYIDPRKENHGSLQIGRTREALEKTLQFMLWDPTERNAKAYGEKIAKLLRKYDLEKYNGEIGKFSQSMLSTYGIDSIADSLNAVRRDLDTKTEDMAKVARMLTDYVLSLGAHNFQQAYKIRKKNLEDRFSNTYDRIDTLAKVPFILCKSSFTVSLNPSKELFKDLVGMTYETAESIADNISWDMEYENNLHGSKNRNSMFQFLRKLLSKGTVEQVRDAFSKLGLSDELLDSFSINTQVKEMDYYEAQGYNTINSRKSYHSHNDYKQYAKIRNKEIEAYIKEKLSAS